MFLCHLIVSFPVLEGSVCSSFIKLWSEFYNLCIPEFYNLSCLDALCISPCPNISVVSDFLLHANVNHLSGRL